MIEGKIENYIDEFNGKTDEHIITLIKGGSDYAQEYLLNKYKPLVKSKARTYFLIGADREDIIQEGMIGLYKAIRDYQSDKNASFHSFADICVSRQIITAVKSATRLKHTPLNTSVSLNRPINESESDDTYMDFIKSEYQLNPETLFIGQESRSYIENHIQEILSKFEMEILLLYLKGKSYVEIAKIIDKPEKSVDNALQRVKKKIEKFISEKNIDGNI